MRAWGSCTKVLVAGSMPCMPATKMKSPARAPRLQVPSAFMAPGGSRVLTPFGEGDCARQKLEAIAIAVTPAKPNRCSIAYSSIWAERNVAIFVYHFERFFADLEKLQRMFRFGAHPSRMHMRAAGITDRDGAPWLRLAFDHKHDS